MEENEILEAPEIEPVGASSARPETETEDGGRAMLAPADDHELYRNHIRSLARQGQALRGSIPGFDLRKELSDPMFARLTSPQVGLSVEDAYYALHRRELQQAAARMTAGSISRAIQAGQMRPRENSGAQAGSVQTTDYSRASREQREQLKEAIRNASARGEKIYP